MDIARQEDVTPAEALIGLVRGAMGRAAYVDGVLSELMRRHVDDGGDPLVPPPGIRAWLKESRNERNLAARMAASAVNAGAMAVLARRMDLEGGLVADALTAALDVLGLDQDERIRALGAAQERLMLAE